MLFDDEVTETVIRKPLVAVGESRGYVQKIAGARDG
jgi:hypothetical protein